MGKNSKNVKSDRSDRPETRSTSADSENSESRMLDQTHTVYESTLTAILLTTNKRIDDLHASLLSNQERRLSEVRAELKAEIANLHSAIDELRSSMTFTAAEVNDIKSQFERVRPSDTPVAAKRLQRIEKELAEHTQQLDYIENQSRRNNVRIDGIPEEKGESWDLTEGKCQSLFTNSLGLSQIQIERAHRTGPIQPAGGKPRPIIARLASFKHQEAVLRRAKERKPRGIFLNQDFSARVSRVRKELRPQIQQMRQRGIECYLSYDKIRYRGHNPNHNPIPSESTHSGHSSPNNVAFQRTPSTLTDEREQDSHLSHGQSVAPQEHAVPDPYIPHDPNLVLSSAVVQKSVPSQHGEQRIEIDGDGPSSVWPETRDSAVPPPPHPPDQAATFLKWTDTTSTLLDSTSSCQENQTTSPKESSSDIL